MGRAIFSLLAIEVADFLVSRGRQVTVVEMRDGVGTELDVLPRTMLLERLKRGGVKIHTNTTLARLTPHVAVARTAEGEIRLPIETVVLAVGIRPNRELLDDLERRGVEVHVVGDAREPRGIGEAVWEGFETALAL